MIPLADSITLVAVPRLAGVVRSAMALNDAAGNAP